MPNYAIADTHVIAIHPDHQGRKAGALWCKWGMDLSDSLGLPLYFEASPSTYKLYEKIGYELLDDKIVHDRELMGTESPIEVPLMVKMPLAACGMSFKEWRAAGYPAFGSAKNPEPVVGSAVESGKTGPMVVTEIQETTA